MNWGDRLRLRDAMLSGRETPTAAGDVGADFNPGIRILSVKLRGSADLSCRMADFIQARPRAASLLEPRVRTDDRSACRERFHRP